MPPERLETAQSYILGQRRRAAECSPYPRNADSVYGHLRTSRVQSAARRRLLPGLGLLRDIGTLAHHTAHSPQYQPPPLT